MSAAVVGSVVGIASGINSLFGGGGGGQASTYDPYADYRGASASMYNNYLTGKTPTNISQMPGYSQYQSGVVNPAMDATKRSMAASGQFSSGNEQIALQGVAQQGYSSFIDSYMNRLAQASGATNNPAQGAQYAQAGQQQGLSNIVGGLGTLSQSGIFSNSQANAPAGYSGIGQAPAGGPYQTMPGYGAPSNPGGFDMTPYFGSF